MTVLVFCATQRGVSFLEKLFDLLPDANYYIFSFRETLHEPPFFESIKQLASTRQARFIDATGFSTEAYQTACESIEIDLLFAVSWRYMIPIQLADKARRVAVVFHDALLPRYRGFAPTVWAILNGESQTGATLFHLSDSADSGDIIAQRNIPIAPDDTIAQVMSRVTQSYLDLLEINLPLLLNGTAPRYPQDASRATYTCKRIPEDNEINWHRSTQEIYNLIRGVTHPYPGAFTWLNGKKITIWSASIPPDAKPYCGRIPGAVAEIRSNGDVIILTADGMLCVHTVQIEGTEEIPAASVIKRYASRLGRKS